MRSRSQKPSCDKQRYRGRNRIECLFNENKNFRRIATRYDKLLQTFLEAVHLAAFFLIVKDS